MATTTVSIGSNQSIVTLTPNVCNSLSPSSDGWEVGFTAGSISADVSVGDIQVYADASSSSNYYFLVTAINGARTRCNLKYLTDDSATGSASPCAMYNDWFEQQAGVFKRAFSTITLFEAMVDDSSPTYWGSSDHVVGECHGDSNFTDSRVYFDNKQSLASVKLTAILSDRHDGTASGSSSGKVLIRPTVGTPTNQGIIEVNIDNFILEWVEIDFDALDSATSHKAIVLGGTNDDNIIRNNLIHDKYGNPGAVGPNMIFVGGAGASADTLYILNNIIYNVIETDGDHAVAINVAQWAGNVYVYNNTMWNITSNDSGTDKYAYGVQFGNAAAQTAFIKNNIVSKLTSDDDNERAYSKVLSGATSTVANNLSDDTTNATYDAKDMGQSLNDSSALIGKTEAQIDFVSVTGGSEDLHIDTSSVCREAGVDLGTTNEVNIDIDGFDRDSNGVVWDMGADQTTNDASTANPAFLLMVI